MRNGSDRRHANNRGQVSIDNELDHELRQVIARLSLVSHVGAAPLQASPRNAARTGGDRPTGGLDHADDRAFSFEQKSAEYFERRRSAARGDDEQLAAILADAKTALQAWTHAKKPGGSEDQPDLRSRILAEGVGHPARAVANNLGCTVSRVNKVRVEANRDATTGEPIDEAGSIEDMRARGLGWGTIARLKGMSKTTIMRQFHRGEQAA